MKKMIAIVLTFCMVFGVSACGNNTDNTGTESSTNNTNGTALDEEHYNYATEALAIVDKFLNNEIEKENAASEITALSKKVVENGDYGIDTLNITLNLLETVFELSNLNINSVEEYRDDLAALLNVPLIYRETAKKAFGVTSKEFFDAVNTSLQSTDSSLVLELDKVEKIEKEEENYLPVSFYVLKHNNVLIEYETDNATDKLLSLEIGLNFNEKKLKEDDIVALGGYIGVTSTMLETEKEAKEFVYELITQLDLENFSENNVRSYDTDNIHYTKMFLSNNFALVMKPK